MEFHDILRHSSCLVSMVYRSLASVFHHRPLRPPAPLYAHDSGITLATYVLPRLLARSYRGFLGKVPSPYTISCRAVLPLQQSFYDLKAFFAHAALLGQGFPHCRKFLLLPPVESGPCLSPNVAVALSPATHRCLAGRCPANQLMRHRSIPALSHKIFGMSSMRCSWLWVVLAGVSSCYPHTQGRLPMYYSPVCHSSLKRDSLTCMWLARRQRSSWELASNSPLNMRRADVQLIN